MGDLRFGGPCPDHVGLCDSALCGGFVLSYRYFALGVGFGRSALCGGFALGVSFVRVTWRRFHVQIVRVRNLV